MRPNWLSCSSRHQIICLLAFFSIFAVTGVTKITSTDRAYKVQDNQLRKLSVDDPRPVAEAVRLLQEKYGLIITYEDPRLVHETDLVDNTDPKYRQAHPGGLRALDPRGGHLEIDYVVSPVTGKPEDPRALLQRVLDAHAAAGNPGRFRITQSGQFFHVIPAQVKNSRGEWSDQGSVLDTRITFPEQERTVYETIEIINGALSQATKIKFVVNPGRVNLAKYRTAQGASGEPARDTLVRTLESTNRKFSWLLLYSKNLNWFVLNLRSVPN